MPTQFICLANSKKYNERCIAGVVVSRNKKGKYIIKNENGKPKWIRPVTGENHGQVPSSLVEGINLLDVVEIEIQEEVPNGYQSENVAFNAKSLRVVGKIKARSKNLDLLVNSDELKLFGNKGKAIHQDDIEQLTTSLTLIKIRTPITYIRREYQKEQYRLKFSFNSFEYDLPITDIKFVEYCKSLGKKVDLGTLINDDAFVTISVGTEYRGFYYKLVAGVIQEGLLEKQIK